ncbi:MAG TPA: Maf family nucleotide pyrophosphatase [Bacteroidales bacterium]|nr:Maf family nucleotide pyrophosphatase [Bacteroidales bacterium]
MNVSNYQIILASGSPRRQELLGLMGIDFVKRLKPVEEIFPPEMKPEEAARFLCEKKAMAFEDFEIAWNELIITADTIVCLDDEILNKPENRTHAIEMLQKLSGKKHLVITGVAMRSRKKLKSFTVSTNVSFKKLTDEEIIFYVDNFRPFDKAGAYGIQEWIGFIGITAIDGSYYNVVGLPTARLYDELANF